MDILVIDRDSLTGQLLASKLEALGHKVTVEPVKQTAFDLIALDNFDCVLIDPAPVPDPRPVVIGIWKALKSKAKPYIMLFSKSGGTEEAVLAGANDTLAKPLSSQEIEEKIGNAARLMDINKLLAREDNVHSGGGMVGKAAFYQLYLSAIDRAFRYGEKSLIVFIHMTNRDTIISKLGVDGYEQMITRLSEKMTFMRRQSDVIGRLSEHDFAILLQRPQYESEPIDAINRFAETLQRFCGEFGDRDGCPQLTLQLIALPQGSLNAEKSVI